LTEILRRHAEDRIVGAIVKDPVSDAVVWQEYLETVVRERDGWREFYRATRTQ